MTRLLVRLTGAVLWHASHLELRVPRTAWWLLARNRYPTGTTRRLLRRRYGRGQPDGGGGRKEKHDEHIAEHHGAAGSHVAGIVTPQPRLPGPHRGFVLRWCYDSRHAGEHDGQLSEVLGGSR